jgi:hypothetical protein
MCFKKCLIRKSVHLVYINMCTYTYSCEQSFIRKYVENNVCKTSYEFILTLFNIYAVFISIPCKKLQNKYSHSRIDEKQGCQMVHFQTKEYQFG